MPNHHARRPRANAVFGMRVFTANLLDPVSDPRRDWPVWGGIPLPPTWIWKDLAVMMGRLVRTCRLSRPS